MKLLTIDGNSIVNRAFYGIRALNAGDGTPTNAVFGFLTILQKLIADEAPDALCVAFDMHEPTFRHLRYDGYKATRKGMPEDLVVQMPILKEVLDAMNIPRYETPGWEADDILGSISKKCEADGWECIIVTGDKDALQLVTELTRVKNIKTRAGQTETVEYTPAAFFEEYGFEPLKIIDLKALMGDSSDNIPGVAGVGEKTALDLVQRFGGIDEIYQNLENLDIKDTVRKKLEAGRESAELSFELATIRTNAPFAFEAKDNLCQSPDNDRLYELFKRLGFMRFIRDYGLHPPVAASPVTTIAKPEIIEIKSAEDRDKLLEAVKTADIVGLRLDTDYFDRVAVSIVEARGKGLPDAGKARGSGPVVYLLRKGATEGFDSALSLLLSGEVKKAGHDTKDIMRACLERGIETSGWVFDSALAAYLVSPTDSSYAIPGIVGRYCGYAPGADSDEGGQMSMLSDSGKSIADEAYAIELLVGALGDKLRELELVPLYNEIEAPLCGVLAEMEHFGFLVDKEALAEFGESLSTGIAGTMQQIFDLAGEDFNIGSPKQLGTILFDKLMLPAPKKTKTGYSTDIEVLNRLSGKHPIIELIKDYRELTKLKSTYADGLLKVIGQDGRIHTHFQMTVTATGRLSSTEPNLQNIPVRKEMGRGLRKMFIAGEGNLLVDADYSQIELRLLAHIADDPVMIEAFERGEDIHAVTASQVFGVALSEVAPIQRFRAKAVNFGIVYGISPFSLANDIGVTPKEAKAYIDSYLENYAGVRAYMAGIVERAKKYGYVATLFGRRRPLPELKSPNHNTRSFGERVALNMPIQGTAADIMKIAMIKVSNKLKAEGLKARPILQVHDELIVECPEAEAGDVARILRGEMENAARLSVPLVADTRAGKSWHDAK